MNASVLVLSNGHMLLFLWIDTWSGLVGLTISVELVKKLPLLLQGIGVML